MEMMRHQIKLCKTDNQLKNCFQIHHNLNFEYFETKENGFNLYVLVLYKFARTPFLYRRQLHNYNDGNVIKYQITVM